MNVSLKGDYALRAVFDLAVHGSSRPVSIAEVARRQKIPRKFLELILAGLKQAGLVESRRGVQGGYLLARPGEAITVGEVLRVVEGVPRPGGKRSLATPFSELWRQVDRAVSEIVDSTTFAQLGRAWEERQRKYVPNWDI